MAKNTSTPKKAGMAKAPMARERYGEKQPSLSENIHTLRGAKAGEQAQREWDPGTGTITAGNDRAE